MPPPKTGQSSKRPPKTGLTRSQELESTRDKFSFHALCINALSPAEYSEILTSCNHYSSAFVSKGDEYPVPKYFEKYMKNDQISMTVWNTNVATILTDKEKCWFGRFCVWYVPADELLYVTKLGKGPKEVGKGPKEAKFVDVPKAEEGLSDRWIAREMKKLREEFIAALKELEEIRKAEGSKAAEER